MSARAGKTAPSETSPSYQQPQAGLAKGNAANRQRERFHPRSPLIYYWPTMLAALICGATTWLNPAVVEVTSGNEIRSVSLSASPMIGALFLGTLLTNILLVSVNLRGIWSVVVLLGAILGFVLFQEMGVWQHVVPFLQTLQFYFTLEFYFTTAAVLVSSLVLVTWLYDQRQYIEITPSVVKVIAELGEPEFSLPIINLTMAKKRDNIALHLLLGFGSGDLILKTGDREFHLENVPNVSRVLRRIAEVKQSIGRDAL